VVVLAEDEDEDEDFKKVERDGERLCKPAGENREWKNA